MDAPTLMLAMQQRVSAIEYLLPKPKMVNKKTKTLRLLGLRVALKAKANATPYGRHHFLRLAPNFSAAEYSDQLAAALL